MSLRTYAIPLALVGLGIGLGVVSDRPPESPSFADPMAEVQSAAEPLAAEAVPVAADPATDPDYAMPVQEAAVPVEPPSAEALRAETEAMAPTDGSEALGEPLSDEPDPSDPPVELGGGSPVPVADLPDGILPDGVVSGQPYAPVGEEPYQVITTNPMACIPAGAPGCFSGVSCCGDLVCIEDVCIQSH